MNNSEITPRKFLSLKDISCYRISFKLSNKVWHIIIQWNYFAKDTIGKQFIRAIDSISANIAEGFARRSKKDKIRFFHFAYGSLYESLDWNQKAYLRRLLNKSEYLDIYNELNKLPKEINTMIKFTKNNISK